MAAANKITDHEWQDLACMGLGVLILLSPWVVPNDDMGIMTVNAVVIGLAVLLVSEFELAGHTAREEAANAVGACRYPRLKSAPLHQPPGIRGDGPTAAARYWGLSQQDYYQKADVWPLNPRGEIFCILQIEDTRGVENLDDMLKNVPGIGAILIGEGDLSQELGYPRQYEHKVVLEWMKRVVDTCKKHDVVVGHPHVEAGNCERIVAEGYRFLMMAPVQSYNHLEKTRAAAGRT